MNGSEIEAPFELTDRSRSEVVAEVREKLATLSGVNVEIGQPISHRIDAMLSGTKANIAIKLFGDDLNRMFSLASQIRDKIQDVEGGASTGRPGPSIFRAGTPAAWCWWKKFRRLRPYIPETAEKLRKRP